MIEDDIRCYVSGLLAWNNESIKMLSGPHRLLLNRTFYRKGKTLHFIWLSLIKVRIEVTTTAKYNSYTARHCPLHCELGVL